MEIGKSNSLKAARTTENGCYLMDEEGNEVLLPNAYVPDSLKLGDQLEVFLYKDNEQRPVATTLKPKIQVDEFAYLEVKDVNKAGAFIDMGVVKQLLVPYSEQPIKMEEGEKYVVFCLVDEETDRLIGSAQLEDFIFTEDLDVVEGDEVELLVYKRSDLGMSVIVNQMYQGLIFHSEVHQPITIGDKLKGYVKNVRADGKLDIVLRPQGYRNEIDSVTQSVLDILNKEGGFFKYHDKSDPEEIKSVFRMSKKAFKRALGNLYKNRIVELSKDGTKLLKK